MAKWLKRNWTVLAALVLVFMVNSFVRATEKPQVGHSPKKEQQSSHTAEAAKVEEDTHGEAEEDTHAETAGSAEHAATGEHGEAGEQGEEGEHEEGEHEEGGLAAIEPGFLLHLTIPIIFPKDPACDHSSLELFQKFHHTKDCGVPNVITVGWILVITLTLLGRKGGRNLQTIPGRYQGVWEYIVEGVYGLVDEMIGHHGRRYGALIGSLILFIFSANVIGLFPGMISPSTSLSNNLALAFTVFFFTHYAGFHAQGKGYLKHFTGPMMALAPIMVPLHIIGELVRPISLSLRLFGNILGEEIVIMVLFMLAPYGGPLPMMAFAIFGGMIQTAVFVLLSTIYIGGAVTHEEES